jgi:asparagine synthase (glutamine-hydrolysing)
LETKGAIFQTTGDTEVILEAYKAWGTKCLQRFNGMFAFAIWDSVDRRLFIARDRLGKKPLFYYPTEHGLTFASELKALREDPEVPQKLNFRALGQYLSLNYVLTSEVIFKGCRKVPPAHYIILEPDRPMRLECYWDLSTFFIRKPDFKSLDEAAEELEALVADAVSVRMVSDRPLGAFLSGGIDSSAIVAAMCDVKDRKDIETFSVGFEDPSYDERTFSRYAAENFGVKHRDRSISDSVARELPEICYFADEPFADTSMFPTFALAKLTREHVVVSLSGDGGDELFAGYETYRADKLRAVTSWMPGWLMRGLEIAFNMAWPSSRKKVSFDFKVRRFLEGHGLDPLAAHFSWRRIFSETEKRSLVNPDLCDEILVCDPVSEFRKFEAEVSQCHYLDRMAYVDIKTWLADGILVKLDRMTMAHSLEARAPFLDYRLVEFAAGLPTAWKMRGLQGKHIFKRSQRNRLPASIHERPKKGFNAPIADWMARPDDGLFKDLSPRDLAGEFFQPDTVERLCVEHWAGKKDNSLKLFSLMNLYFWRQQKSLP